jgi:cell division protein FtsI (penicillin-binding protein 3)
MTTRATRSPRRRTVIALGVVLAVLSAFIVRLVAGSSSDQSS